MQSCLTPTFRDANQSTLRTGWSARPLPSTEIHVTDPSSRIAVICAHNPKNSGMYCVDNGARLYFSSRKIPHDLIVTQGRHQIGDLRYVPVATPRQLKKYETVVYWGDFLTNPMWGLRDYTHRHSPTGSTSTTAEWVDLYLRLKSINPGTRIVVAGGCALGSADPQIPAEIADAYRHLLASADELILRDPGSVQTVQQVQPQAHPQLGFDCASLWMPPPRQKLSPAYFAYAFHRTLPKADADRVVKEAERLTGMKGIEIGWLKNRWPSRLFHLRLTAQLALIARARFCLTDIYHLSVCSMARNTPAICVAGVDDVIESTLNETKKHLLFELLNIPNHLITWRDHWETALQHAIESALLTSPTTPPWKANFDTSRQRLIQQLDDIFLTPARSG